MKGETKIWKRVLFMTAWSLVATGVLVLLIAAVRKQSEQLCKDVVITIKGVDGVEYVSKKQILSKISGGKPESLIGSRVRSFQLNKIEEQLEQHLWIRKAELFFDNKEVLHVEITERQPVARVFSINGESFYVDEMGEILPINTDQVARVPVFTSFPLLSMPFHEKDSLLLLDIREMGRYLMKHDFWMAQIEQVNISNYEMELIPKLGRHTILFGNGAMLEQKFNRLLLFYKKVMTKTGWGYYNLLDVRYSKQLVAAKNDSTTLLESYVLPKDTIKINPAINLNHLPQDSGWKKPITDDTVASVLTSEPVNVRPKGGVATVKTKTAASVPGSKVNNPNPSKTSSGATGKSVQSSSNDEDRVLREARQSNEQKKQSTKPKAVMQKNNQP